MKKQRSLTIEEIRSFAAAYAAGTVSAEDARAEALIAQVQADKKFPEKAGQAPEIVPFLLDHGLIPKEQLMEYYVKISWLEHRDVILQLKDFENGKRSPKHAAAPVQTAPGKTEAEIKAEWRTEKCEDGTLRLLAYKGTDTVIEIPERIGKAAVSEIGPFAFSPLQPRLKAEQKAARERIREVRMGDCIRALGESCFEGCRDLTDVTLPKSLKAIPKRAFADCKVLAAIELPDGLKTMGVQAFCACEKLETIRLPESLDTFEMGANGWFSKTNAAFSGCSALKRVSLPRTLKVIPREFFSGCTALETIQLPEGLEEIGYGVFHDCTALKKLILPEGIKRLGSYAFQSSGVTELRLPPSLESLGEYSALSGSRIQRLTLCFGTLQRFRELRLADASLPDLREYVLETEDTELTVKDGALYTADMKTLLLVPPVCGKEFRVPDGVEQIEEKAFRNCGAETILLPDSVKSIGKACFAGSAVESLVLPEKIPEIPEEAFYRCGKLKSVAIPEGACRIGEGAFWECESLEQISVPGSVKVIEKRAFRSCEKLRELRLEDGVEEIGAEAFANCGRLEKAVIPASVKNLQETRDLRERVFYQCPKLTIYGKAGSAAEEYARNFLHRINFQPI